MVQTTLLAILMFLFQNGQELYQQALVQERAAGNLEAAIQLYQDAARNSGGDRTLAAQALIGAARCYELLGKANAREIYDDVARNYPDQQQQAAIARERGSALEGVHEFALAVPPDGRVEQRFFLRYNATPGDRLISVGPGMFWQALPEISSNKRITIKGPVSRIDWTNPSVSISIEVGGPDGTVRYRVIGANPYRLIQDGFTRDAVKLGEIITVDGFLGDSPDVIGNATITLADGRKFSFGTSVSGVTVSPR
jgi:hypothetical protein